MKYLALYDEDQRASVEKVQRLSTERGHGSCRRCGFYSRASSVCIQPEIAELGSDGRTVLLVGELPGRNEDAMDRPFTGASGRLLRDEVAKHWQGTVVFDNALKCFAGSIDREKKTTTAAVESCRGYLRETVELAKPERVIALGSVAALSLLGRGVPPYSVRRGFGFLGDGTPVFLGINPAAGLRNRFVKKWFKEDLAWALSCELPVASHWDAEYCLVETEADAHRAADELRRHGFGFDTETAGVFGDIYFETLCVAACAFGSDFPWVWDDNALRNPKLARPLLDVMADERVIKGGHNAKHDMLAMRFGCKTVVKGPIVDTMLDRRAIKADALARLEYASELVGMGGHKRVLDQAKAAAIATIEAARADRKKSGRTGGKGTMFLPGLENPAIEAALRLLDVSAQSFCMALVPKPVLLRYCALDTVAHVRLVEHQAPILRARNIEKSSNLMRQAVVAYEQVEAWGMGVSLQAMKRFNDYTSHRKTEYLGKLKKEVGSALPGFDPESRDHVEQALFDVLKLKSRERDKTPSGKRGTDKHVLRRLKDKHPFVKNLMAYRSYAKLLGTYAEGFLPHVRADGRIHPNVKVSGTETGRPSCEDPNLQNLPRANTEAGKMARDCFIAPMGRMLVEADYSQIEIRVGAMLSNERRMIAAFLAGEDLHLRTTRIISRDAWGIDPAMIDPDKHDKERSESKVTTFGLMYGKTAVGLADDLNISIERADKLITLVLGGYPDFAAWAEEERLRGSESGETWTWWNGEIFRRRPIWQIGDQPESNGKPTRRAVTAANSCVNTPIQGTASDYCLHSLVEVVRLCIDGWIPAKVVITVHDSIMLECDEDDVDEVAVKVRDVMLQWPTLHGVPLVVDFKKGRSWGSLKKFEPSAMAA